MIPRQINYKMGGGLARAKWQSKGATMIKTATAFAKS